MPLIETIKIWSDIGQNVTLSVAALITAYFGARGLTAWRRELGGRAKFEAAREILRALYEARDSALTFLDSLRSVLWADDKRQHQHWLLLRERIRNLQSLSFELEINFGARMNDKISPLLSLGAACDQMMLETGGSKMTLEQLQGYLKPTLRSHITDTVDNLESTLTKHIR